MLFCIYNGNTVFEKSHVIFFPSQSVYVEKQIFFRDVKS